MTCILSDEFGNYQLNAGQTLDYTSHKEQKQSSSKAKSKKRSSSRIKKNIKKRKKRKIGEYVCVKWEGTWYPAIIEEYYSGDNTYDVYFQNKSIGKVSSTYIKSSTQQEFEYVKKIKSMPW